MKPVYRAAIVGTGRIASTYDDEVLNKPDPSFYRGAMRHNGLYTALPVNHAEAYRTLPGFDLVAAANRSEEKLRAFGRRWDVTALYTDFMQMLEKERPDVVSVCTRSPEKAGVTVAAAEAGVKAIVVEKALATSMEEADVMLRACKRSGALLVVNHPNRFSRTNRSVKALIDSGQIGPVGVALVCHAGGMLHTGTHVFDLLRFLVGDIVEMSATIPEYEPDKDLPAIATLTFADGATGLVDHVHRVTDGTEIRGTDGYVTTSSNAGDGWLFRVSPLYPDCLRKYPGHMTLEPIEPEPSPLSPTQLMLSELHQTLSGGVPFISTGQDGAAALELGIACHVSHLAGAPVCLPLADRAFRVPNR